MKAALVDFMVFMVLWVAFIAIGNAFIWPDAIKPYMMAYGWMAGSIAIFSGRLAGRIIMNQEPSHEP